TGWESLTNRGSGPDNSNRGETSSQHVAYWHGLADGGHARGCRHAAPRLCLPRRGRGDTHRPADPRVSKHPAAKSCCHPGKPCCCCPRAPGRTPAAKPSRSALASKPAAGKPGLTAPTCATALDPAAPAAPSQAPTTAHEDGTPGLSPSAGS